MAKNESLEPPDISIFLAALKKLFKPPFFAFEKIKNQKKPTKMTQINHLKKKKIKPF